MAAKRTRKTTDSADAWLNELAPTNKDRPEPASIGVEIRCRILVEDTHDWQYVDETLQRCREYGAADVVDYRVFRSEKTTT